MKKIIILVLISLFSTSLWAATVRSIKKNKLLIVLDGQSANPGDRFFVIDSAGKKKAIVQIRQVKRGRAVAQLIKGRPAVGMTLAATPISTGSKAARTSRASTPTDRVSYRSGNSIGFLGSLLQTNMTADFVGSTGTSTSVVMKGMTFGALGYYDYALTPDFQLRATAGVEQLKVSGTVDGLDCDSSTSCDVSITYLSMYGGAKYNLVNNSSMRLWGGAGYGFLWALSKASTVLRTADITSNQIYVFSAGMDFPLQGGDSYIPVTIDYGMFPSSPTVKANIMFIRAGWAKSF